jgi:hypothetical protein
MLLESVRFSLVEEFSVMESEGSLQSLVQQVS